MTMETLWIRINSNKFRVASIVGLTWVLIYSCSFQEVKHGRMDKGKEPRLTETRSVLDGFCFSIGDLKINNIPIKLIDEDMLTDSLKFRKIRNKEGVIRYYNLKSFLQFDASNELLYAQAVDQGIVFNSMNLAVGNEIDPYLKNSLEGFNTEFYGIPCNAFELFDKEDNTLIIYHDRFKVIGFTFSSYNLIN